MATPSPATHESRAPVPRSVASGGAEGVGGYPPAGSPMEIDREPEGAYPGGLLRETSESAGDRPVTAEQEQRSLEEDAAYKVAIQSLDNAKKMRPSLEQFPLEKYLKKKPAPGSSIKSKS